MRRKMVRSCLKLTQNSFNPLKNSQQKCFKCLRQTKKMNSGKIVKQKEEIISTEKILYW